MARDYNGASGMPIALTIFGIPTKKARNAILCYAYSRDVRGPGQYPEPTLPKDSQSDGTTRLPLEGFESLELICWDKILDDQEASELLKNLDKNQFSVPNDCPIEGGVNLPGQFCTPNMVDENRSWVRSSGSGILWCRTLALASGMDRISENLAELVGAGRTPAALLKIIELIAQQSGLGEIFQNGRRIGLLDHFYREENDLAFFGPLLIVVAEKPDLRGNTPMLRCRVQRWFAAQDRAFTLRVSLANFDEGLTDYVVELPSGVPEIFIEAGSHITDVVLEAFNPDGKIAQRLVGAFTQNMEFGITAQGRSDLLPKVFKGAPESPDLQSRPRVSTVAFKGPSAGNRSGGFDEVRSNRDRVAALIGKESWSAECVWFERDSEGQIAVIRWIKSKLEKPGVAKAFLVDPFLGSEALQRVIARQGNENINLTILISPGDVDPDAESLDAKATEKHAGKLAATANEWSSRLCGQVSIIDVQRGDGTRQAFHDRYLGIIDQSGIPTYYLLSNSLSKAGGDWPFAISELSRITSHRVHAYVQNLLAGVDGDRTVKPVAIFERAGSKNILNEIEAEPVTNADRPEWATAVETFLERLLHAATRNSKDGREIDETVDEFLTNGPADADPGVLATNIFRFLGYREQNIVRISSRFAAGAPHQAAVASKIDDLLLDDFFKKLPSGAQKPNCSWVFIDGRDELLRHLGKIIARRKAPTNFVRDYLNPILDTMIRSIELQRGDSGTAFELVQIATCIVSLGLEVARIVDAQQKFKEGIAIDYIHWSGRLARSETAHIRFDGGAKWDDHWSADLSFCVNQVRAARAALGSALEVAMNRVLNDAFVLPAFKEMVAGKRAATSPPKRDSVVNRAALESNS